MPDLEVTREQSRCLFGFPQESLIIGTLSRLVPHKGIADLIKSMSLIKDKQTKLFLAVAGDGPEKAKLEDLASEYLPGNHLFLGRVKDVNQFMSAIDVFVLPSYMEGFGLVFIEAAFHGVPSVGTNVGGVPDVVIANKTGLLVPPGNKQSLADAIERFPTLPNQ
jgi:glycosyltransferase involved in cell wall biosynthesis